MTTELIHFALCSFSELAEIIVLCVAPRPWGIARTKVNSGRKNTIRIYFIFVLNIFVIIILLTFY